MTKFEKVGCYLIDHGEESRPETFGIDYFLGASVSANGLIIITDNAAEERMAARAVKRYGLAILESRWISGRWKALYIASPEDAERLDTYRRWADASRARCDHVAHQLHLIGRIDQVGAYLRPIMDYFERRYHEAAGA